MIYKVIPFVPGLDRNNPSGGAAADAVSTIVNKNAAEGWRYVRIETVNAWVAADKGCFGIIGGSPGYNMSAQMIVFEKDN